jgi:hypothetical protein
MKNLLIYYFSILLPLPLLVWSAFNDTLLFIFLLISYIIYRRFTDSKRLIEKGLLSKKDAWKVFVIPFYSTYYFKELYFEK